MCAITEEEPRMESQEEAKRVVDPEAPEERPESPEPGLQQAPRYADVLAYVTQKQKQAFLAARNLATRFADTTFGRILLHTTQPAHVLAIVGVILVAYMFMPTKQTRSVSSRSPVMSFIFVTSVGIHVGAQFWMTFISGLALYFSLPRHVFGDVQKVLFPKYFALNAILSAFTLVSFQRLHKGTQWETRHWVQMSSIGTCFLLELLIRLYAVPVVLRLITAKNEVEKKVPGVGREIGEHNPGRLGRCPYYRKLHKTFRRLHLLVAVGNIATIACTSFQLVYLQQSLMCL